uniref:ATP-dependent RNA helicase n=1 Tax=Piliocolobus tephrosceles TaxID=591936 RepID=A0A8C9H5Z8_9PRIM
MDKAKKQDNAQQSDEEKQSDEKKQSDEEKQLEKAKQLAKAKRLDKKKINEIRKTLSSNCRIIKVENEQIYIASWNSIKKNTPINSYIIDKLINKFLYTKFLPCQSTTLEYTLLYKNGSNSILNGDMYIEAPTGLGKTLCYVIPILDYYLSQNDNTFFCVILTPTEELVKQVTKVITMFDIKNLIISTIKPKTYNTNMCFDEINNENDFYKSHVNTNEQRFEQKNILITTTTKFEMLFYSNQNIFKKLKYLIIDEVDSILNMDFVNINIVVNALTKLVQQTENNIKYSSTSNNSYSNATDSNLLYKPKHFLQKILLSATICKVSNKLLSLNLYRPIFFYYILNYARNYEFYLHVLKKSDKLCNLIHLIQKTSPNGDKNILIFCNTEETVHFLFRFLTVYFSHVEKKLLQN